MCWGGLIINCTFLSEEGTGIITAAVLYLSSVMTTKNDYRSISSVHDKFFLTERMVTWEK